MAKWLNTDWLSCAHQHHAVRVLLADLADEQSSHTRPCAASQGVADLEACEQGKPALCKAQSQQKEVYI